MSPEASIVVTIPSFKETTTEKAVLSLFECEHPGTSVLVLVLVNEPEGANELIRSANRQIIQNLHDLTTPAGFELRVSHATLPQKKAGVGLARKILMDEGARLFHEQGKEGVIVCFDADCACSPDFLKEVWHHFDNHQTQAAITYFEHPLDHEEILQYELFLRYYVDAQRYAGHPFAHQTLGSCISVRSDIYKKVGGMNTRKAGEDFYFLQKVIPMGGFEEINTAAIYPSSRVSDRVPFGTGHAISKIRSQDEYPIYNFQSFDDLRRLFANPSMMFLEDALPHDLPDSIQAFHEEHKFREGLSKMQQNSASRESFAKHFFRWWDGFRVLKFVHFARDHFHKDMALEEAIHTLNDNYWKLPLQEGLRVETLQQIRQYDRLWPRSGDKGSLHLKIDFE